jgi:uncharacterized surface protein with fasciclin (FAS1) repeats
MSFSVSAQTIFDLISSSTIHNTLEAAVIAAALDDDLAADGSLTVFAPTDEAFENLPEGVVDALLQDPTGRLADILLYHVIGSGVASNTLMDGQMITTLQGQDITVTFGDFIRINDAIVTVIDVPATNGVVHFIDAVILPTYPATVVDVIVESDIHNTLETAVSEAGLVGALSGEGPFTVFAPTDEAFEALPAGLLNELLMDPTGDLTSILQYHVAGLEASSGGLTDGQLVPTLLGEEVTIGIDQGVFVDQAEVVAPNIYTGNGIVHVINAVLLPNVVSVSEVGQSAFDIAFFPNPVSDFLIMEINDSAINTVEIILFNSVGQEVRNWRMADNVRTFDLQDLPAGNYYMDIRINGDSFHKKLVKH